MAEATGAAAAEEQLGTTGLAAAWGGNGMGEAGRKGLLGEYVGLGKRGGTGGEMGYPGAAGLRGGGVCSGGGGVGGDGVLGYPARAISPGGPRFYRLGRWGSRAGRVRVGWAPARAAMRVRI